MAHVGASVKAKYTGDVGKPVFDIICIRKDGWSVVAEARTKREAKRWIEANRGRFPGCRLDFVRKGFWPVI